MEPIVVEVDTTEAAVRVGDLWIYRYDTTSPKPEDPVSYAVPYQVKIFDRGGKLYAGGWADIKPKTFWLAESSPNKYLVVTSFDSETREIKIKSTPPSVVGPTSLAPWAVTGGSEWLFWMENSLAGGYTYRTVLAGVVSHVVPKYFNDTAMTLMHHAVFVTMQGAAKVRLHRGYDKTTFRMAKKRGDAVGKFCMHLREPILSTDNTESLRDVHIARYTKE